MPAWRCWSWPPLWLGRAGANSHIAEQHGIPSRFLVQILLQLKGAGLVASTRGARAGYISLTTGNSIRATSTISQQPPAQVFLNNSRDFSRKVREAMIAMALEWKFSKAEILELYLNKVYFGGGAYGVDAAARKFFGHPATMMSVSEAAIVAGLVKAPSNYSPTADRKRAIDRAKVVLGLMQTNGVMV